MVVGASGIGKTQLGLQFARAGLAAGEPSGIVFDMNARIDPQSHADYARRMFGWQLSRSMPRAGPLWIASLTTIIRPAITCTFSIGPAAG